jgi:signal transduction histidine kinase
VAIADRGDRLVIEVSVDGSGEADPHADSGLRAIADRAAAVGGRLDVDSASGGGTAVRLELPVER